MFNLRLLRGDSGRTVSATKTEIGVQYGVTGRNLPSEENRLERFSLSTQR